MEKVPQGSKSSKCSSTKLSPKMGRKEMEKMFDNDETFVDNALDIHRKTAPKVTPPKNNRKRPEKSISGF